MDTSYVLIRVYNQETIEVYYFKCNTYCNRTLYKYPICFTANNIHCMFILISLHNEFIFLSTQHKLYLGKELYKAEISIQLNQQYIQE
uniref:DUF4346 domain-containing protein n=1 Tax=Bostrychia tenella TaxID=324755 RepID=A0A1Z1M5V4_9FLOR|nr:hypothetical protein [Bostrychia tenella]ARW61211.1 hypothetical protein [Bostrychia tenella]